MSTSDTSAPRRKCASPSVSTLTLSLSFRYCSNLALTVLSRAVHRCSPPYSMPQLRRAQSSTCMVVPSAGDSCHVGRVCSGAPSGGGGGLCYGVGVVAFLLVAGGAFTGAPSKFIVSWLSTKQASRFLERERKGLRFNKFTIRIREDNLAGTDRGATGTNTEQQKESPTPSTSEAGQGTWKTLLTRVGKHVQNIQNRSSTRAPQFSTFQSDWDETDLPNSPCTDVFLLSSSENIQSPSSAHPIVFT